MENSTCRQAEKLIYTINSSLASSKTRNSGMELLQSLLPSLSSDLLIENILHWTSYCIVQHKEDPVKELKLNTIARLIENSDNVEVFTKKFLTEYLSVTLRACLEYRSEEEHVAGLNCLMQCMKKYPNWFGNHKQKVQSFLIEGLESSSELVNETAAATFVNFLQTGAAGYNGINYVTTFKLEFRRTCATIHSLYNNFLDEISGGYSFEKIDEDVFEFKQLPCGIQSCSNLDIVANRIISCLILMKYLIVKKFSVEKRIEVKHVLDIICRGLSAHICSSASTILNPTGDQSIYLKQIQLHLLSIFRVFVKRFHSTLVPFSVVIENVFLNILRRVDKCNCFVVDMSFKASLYKSLNNWLSASNTINNELQFQEKIISIIFKDIMPPRKTISLNVKNVDNEKNCERRISMNKEIVCVEALESLKCLLLLSLTIDQNLLKEVLLFIIDRLNNPEVDKVATTYFSALHQVKLYELLILFIKTEHSQILPSVHFTVNLLNKGLSNRHWKISQMSKLGLDLLEKICQPLSPSLHLCTIISPLQNTPLNKLSADQYETSEDSTNKSKKEINILSNILINTSNDTKQLDTENNVVINTEIAQRIEEASQTKNTTICLSDPDEAITQDVNPEVNVTSDVALEKMFCSFQDVVQE